MPTIRTVHKTDKVKVAAIFEPGGIKPVWFQIAGAEPVRISQVCAAWYRTQGSAQIITFEIWGNREKYSLEYDTGSLSWSIGETVIDP